MTRAVAQRTPSAHPPQVTLLSPNGGEVWAGTSQATVRWTASDADGDTLSFTLLYSPNNGGSWSTLASNRETTQYAVNAASLAGSTQALVRVIASDGIHRSPPQIAMA